ncbi:MAG: hypothetical protein ACXV3U_08865 [Halobacteriota archaeon]
MDPNEDVTIVFAEPAVLFLKDNQELLPQEYRTMIGVSDHFRILWHILHGEHKHDVLEELIKNGAAIKLKQLIAYFGEFYVESMALNIAATVGSNIYVLSAQGTAGVTITINPQSGK